MRGFLPVFETPERIREVITNDCYIAVWFMSYARMVQEKDLKIPVLKDYAFAADVAAYCLDLSSEEVHKKLNDSCDMFDPTMPEGTPHPIKDAINTYHDVAAGREPWGLMELKERFKPTFPR